MFRDWATLFIARVQWTVLALLDSAGAGIAVAGLSALAWWLLYYFALVELPYVDEVLVGGFLGGFLSTS